MAGPLVVDGGLATELEAAGHDLSDGLWSARLLLSQPEAIEAVHLAYYRAGARVATTASYQASIPGFAAAGLDRATALDAIRTSVALARRARDRFVKETGRPAVDGLLVAGSVGPYGAMLADGSEYRGDYDPGPAALAAFHRPRIETLVAAGVDLLAIETIPTVREAEVIVGLLDEVAVPAWLSYSCRDGRSTSAGEPIAEAVAVGSHPRVVAVGINCTPPRHLPALLASARDATTKPLIAYPNDGDRWDPVSRRWVADRAGSSDPGAVASWTSYGATWLGGCCGTGPADIAALAAAVGSAVT
ncbi:MAG TPA: homocysteine S-methyltransferase [Candidatus Limnocylindrales bacterium]|nr:homocysteine S-methyltransferase [Candidatus Limnocylindrales bacterium]